MQLQKQFLEARGWRCRTCFTCSGRTDCINNNYRSYVITLHKDGMARIHLKGMIIISTQLYNLEMKMKNEGLLKTVAV